MISRPPAADFGISKLEAGRGSEPAGVSVTKTSAVMGPPLYMSPEQMQSAKFADAQSDIWALGIILYELLAGHVPFTGEAITEVVVSVTTKPPLPLRGTGPIFQHTPDAVRPGSARQAPQELDEVTGALASTDLVTKAMPAVP